MEKRTKITLIVFGICLIIVMGMVSVMSAFSKEFIGNKTVRIYNNGDPFLDIQLIKNTKTCLTDCYAILRFYPHQNFTIPQNFNENFRFHFKKLKDHMSNIEDIHFERYIEQEYDYPIWVNTNITCETCYTINMTEYPCNCTHEGYYENETRIRRYWKRFNPLGKTLIEGNDYFIKLKGHRKINSTEQAVDWIPQILTYNLSEFAWWNSSFYNCRNLTLEEGRGVFRKHEPVIYNITGLTIANATKEIRIVNAGCYLDGNEQPSQIISSDDTTWAEIIFFPNATLSANTTYSVYYNYSSATAPSYTTDLNVTLDTGNNLTNVSTDYYETQFSWYWDGSNPSARYEMVGIWDIKSANGYNIHKYTTNNLWYSLIGYSEADGAPQVLIGWNNFNENINVQGDLYWKITYDGIDNDLTIIMEYYAYQNFFYSKLLNDGADDDIHGYDFDAYGQDSNVDKAHYFMSGYKTLNWGSDTQGEATVDLPVASAVETGQDPDVALISVWKGDATHSYLLSTASAGYSRFDNTRMNNGEFEVWTQVLDSDDSNMQTNMTDFYNQTYYPLNVYLGDEQTYSPPPAPDLKPTVIIYNPADNSENFSMTIDFLYYAEDDQLLTNCSLYTNETAWGFKHANTSAVVNGSNNTIQEVFSSEGIYLWNINCEDNNSNSSFSDANFTLVIRVDYAPTVINYNPADNSYNNSLTIDFLYYAEDDIGLVNCSLYTNETAWSLKHSNASAIGNASNNTIQEVFSSDGSYLWTVICCDSNSNCTWCDSNFTLHLDTTPPSFSGYQRNPDQPNEDEGFQTNVTVSEYHTVIFEFNGTDNYTVDEHTANQFHWDVLSGNYTAHDYVFYYWYANDSVDNWNRSLIQDFTVANRPPTKPELVYPPADFVLYSNDIINFSWIASTDPDDEDYISYSLMINKSIVNNTFATWVTYLLGEGYWNWTITACDGLGLCNISDDRFLTVDFPPITTLVSPADETSGAGSWSFVCKASDYSGLANISLYGNWSGWGLKQTNSSPVNNTDTSFSESLTTGRYIWNCLGCDIRGNCTFASNNWSMNVDTTPPSLAIYSPTNTTYNYNNIWLNWTASEDLDWSAYELDGTNHTITDLEGWTAYVYDDAHSYTGTVSNPSNFYDQNFNTYGSSQSTTQVYVYQNYTLPSGYDISNFRRIQYYGKFRCTTGVGSLFTYVYVWDYDALTWDTYSTHGCSGSSVYYISSAQSVTDEGWVKSGQPLQVRTRLSDGSGTFNIEYYESYIRYDVTRNISLIFTDGFHNIAVYGNDSVGNMGKSSVVYFTVDTTPPNVNITSPLNITYAYTIECVDLNFTYYDVHSVSCFYSHNNGTNTTIAGCVNGTDLCQTGYTGLVLHDVIVWVNDSYGNINSSQVYFTLNYTYYVRVKKGLLDYIMDTTGVIAESTADMVEIPLAEEAIDPTFNVFTGIVDSIIGIVNILIRGV